MRELQHRPPCRGRTQNTGWPCHSHAGRETRSCGSCGVRWHGRLAWGGRCVADRQQTQRAAGGGGSERSHLSHLIDFRYFSRHAWWYIPLAGGHLLKLQSSATTSAVWLSASAPHRSQLHPLSSCSVLVPPKPAGRARQRGARWPPHLGRARTPLRTQLPSATAPATYSAAAGSRRATHRRAQLSQRLPGRGAHRWVTCTPTPPPGCAAATTPLTGGFESHGRTGAAGPDHSARFKPAERCAPRLPGAAAASLHTRRNWERCLWCLWSAPCETAAARQKRQNTSKAEVGLAGARSI